MESEKTYGVDALLRMPEVVRLTGRSRWTLHREVREHTFTKPVPLGARNVAWPASEIAALNRARVEGASAERLRALVVELHEKRKPAPVAGKRADRPHV